MATKNICIHKEEYNLSKKKEAVAEDIITQLNTSLGDLRKGRVKIVL